MGCSSKHSKTAYGEVFGSYGERRIVIEVKGGYDAAFGLKGMLISIAALDSAVGSLIGLKNFTLVRVEHGAVVTHPLRLMEGAYVASREAFYVPPCKPSGLPKISPKCLVSRIDRLLDAIEELESGTSDPVGNKPFLWLQ